MAALYPEMVHILVNRDSGISNIADLAGKKVNLGEKESGTFLTASKMLNFYNQLASPPVYFYEDPAKAVAKVVAGTLDATFYVASAPISALANLPANANVTLIPATIDGFSLNYNVGSIPATTYPWLTHEIKNTISVWSMLTIGPAIARTQIEGFLDTLYANKQAYADKYHANWRSLDKAASLANIKATPVNGWDYEAMHYFANLPVPHVESKPYFCSASPEGTYTKAVQDLLPIIESTLVLSLTEKHTIGSMDNIIKLYNGECAMILNQADTGGYALSLDKNSPKIAKEVLMVIFADAIMPLYGEAVHLIVNTGSGIESSLDLAGQKINMGQKLSGTFVSAMGVLLYNKINQDRVTRFYDSPAVALPKVISGEYDAMFVVGKAPVSYLVEADCSTDALVPNCVAGDPSTLPIKLVPIQIPYSALNTTLSAKYYPWKSADIPNSPQIMAIFVMSPTLSFDESRMADLINAVYDIPVGDHAQSPTWDETTLEQGSAYFNLFPTFYRWAAAQYFADNMK